jgi:cell division protein FtsQ
LDVSIPLRDRSRPRPSSAALRIAVAAAVVAIAVGAVALSRSSVFRARSIEVTGASHLSRAEVVATARVSGATNVPWLDDEAVERRLEGRPWIESAEVRARLPWTIEIAVVERVPVAVAIQAGREVLMAADGTVLGESGADDDLPRIELPATSALEGARPSPSAAAAAVGAMSPELRARLVVVAPRVDGTLELRLRGGVQVRYGAPVGLARKAAVLERILAWARRERAVLVSVNVTAPNLPAVRLGGP